MKVTSSDKTVLFYCFTKDNHLVVSKSYNNLFYILLLVLFVEFFFQFKAMLLTFQTNFQKARMKKMTTEETEDGSFPTNSVFSLICWVKLNLKAFCPRSYTDAVFIWSWNVSEERISLAKLLFCIRNIPFLCGMVQMVCILFVFHCEKRTCSIQTSTFRFTFHHSLCYIFWSFENFIRIISIEIYSPPKYYK